MRRFRQWGTSQLLVRVYEEVRLLLSRLWYIEGFRQRDDAFSAPGGESAACWCLRGNRTSSLSCFDRGFNDGDEAFSAAGGESFLSTKRRGFRLRGVSQEVRPSWRTVVATSLGLPFGKKETLCEWL